MTIKKAFWILVLAVMFISPDTLLIRLAEFPATVGVFWRSLGSGVGLLIVLLVMRRQLFSRNIVVWIVAVSTAIGQISFVHALEHTTVANVLVLLSGLPTIFAIIFSYTMMGEKTAPQTLLATVVCVWGVSVLAAQGLGATEFVGFGYVLINSILMAFSLTMIKKYKNTDILQAYFLGTIGAIVYALVKTKADVFVSSEPIHYIYASINGLIFQVGFYVCSSIGGKNTPSPIFALLFLLETIIGTITAIVFLDEIPTLETIIGGLIVVSALSVHSIWYLKNSKKNLKIHG